MKWLALVFFLSACAGPAPSKSPKPTPTPTPTPTPAPPPAPVVVPPTATPPTMTTTTLSLPPAPAMTGVQVLPNRSSVRFYVPAVAGAQDYRVFAVTPGVTVGSGSGEQINGAVIACAGLRQHNDCDSSERASYKYNDSGLPEAGADHLFDLPPCDANATDQPKTVLREIELDGLTDTSTVVVEAIDALCPFAGTFASAHQDLALEMSENIHVDINGHAYDILDWPAMFPIYSEAEVIKTFGSLIVNGQGASPLPAFDATGATQPVSPMFNVGHPGPTAPPNVLARAIVSVSPLGTSTPPPGFATTDFFEDFSDDSDQFTKIGSYGPNANYSLVPSWIDTQNDNTVAGTVYQNSHWTLFSSLTDYTDLHIARGQLHTVISDSQEDFSANVMYPPNPVKLPPVGATNDYLHVTFEVQADETGRRYWFMTMCGSDSAGQTYNGRRPATAPGPLPAFMNPEEGYDISPMGWNCLNLTPRGPSYDKVDGAPSDISGTGTARAESGLRVTVNQTIPSPASYNDYYQEMTLSHMTAYGPDLDEAYPHTWQRQLNAAGKPVGVWLDDKLFVSQRTKFDLFIRRDRLVVYVDGEQRLCSDFGTLQLTMAEGALGLGQVLYHTMAELTSDFPRTDWMTTGQLHYRHNTPFVDKRSWDNIGYQQDVQAPAGFDESLCLAATPYHAP